jgi:hypothetical protein
VKRILHEDRYYLAWISFRDLGERFDCLGNLLAILSGVANEERTRSILDFIETHSLDTIRCPRSFLSFIAAIRTGAITTASSTSRITTTMVVCGRSSAGSMSRPS